MCVCNECKRQKKRLTTQIQYNNTNNNNNIANTRITIYSSRQFSINSIINRRKTIITVT